MIESSRKRCKEIMRQLEALKKLPADVFAASQKNILADLQKVIESTAIKILNDFAEGKADPMSYFTGMDDLFSFQDPDDF